MLGDRPTASIAILQKVVIANIGFIEFKEMLARQGYKRVLAVSKKEIKEADKLFGGLFHQ